MDVCLTNYGHCNYVSGKHACIFYDEVRVGVGDGVGGDFPHPRPLLGTGVFVQVSWVWGSGAGRSSLPPSLSFLEEKSLGMKGCPTMATLPRNRAAISPEVGHGLSRGSSPKIRAGDQHRRKPSPLCQ